MPITKASGNSVTAAAKGDLVAGNATNDSGVLSVGANDTVLTADSSTATGLKWATPAAGGMTLLSTTTLSGTSTVISSISQAYQDLYIVINNPFRNASFDSGALRVNPNSTTLLFTGARINGGAVTGDTLANFNGNDLGTTSAPTTNNAFFLIRNYASTTNAKNCFFSMSVTGASSFNYFGFIQTASAISSLQITNQGNSMQYSGGTVLIYGVK
jgi:hypothetical protein